MCPVPRTVQQMVSGLLEIAPHCGSCTVGAGLRGAVGGKQRALGQPGHQGEVLLRETTSTFSPHTARACAHLWVPPSKQWHSACNWWVHYQPAGAGKGCSGVCRPVPCRAVCFFPCDMRTTHITPALQPLPSLVNPPEVNSPAPLPCLQKFPRGAVHAAALSSRSPARWQPAELQPGTASRRRNAARFSLFPAVCSRCVGRGWPGRAEAARSPALGLGPVCSPRCGLHSNPRGQWEPRRSNARRLDRVLWKPGCTPAWPSWLKRPHGFPRRGGGAPTAG